MLAGTARKVAKSTRIWSYSIPALPLPPPKKSPMFGNPDFCRMGKGCNGQIVGQPRRRECPTKCPKIVRKSAKIVQKLSEGAENTIFGHVLNNFCLFGRCFCLVTLSNARPLQGKAFVPYDRNRIAPFFMPTKSATRTRRRLPSGVGWKSAAATQRFVRSAGGLGGQEFKLAPPLQLPEPRR